MKRPTLALLAAWLMAAGTAPTLCAQTETNATVQTGSMADIPAAAMRRPISTQQPLWLIHIDTWNWPDPQKIIDLVPEDIRPYVVFNISLSVSHNDDTGEMTVAPDGYQIARSWLRTCAENRVWAVVQCASGGYSHFSEYDLSVYEEFYRDYPNFLGWNFAEQFWGFDEKFSCSFPERLGLFTELMKLAHRYGGYLITSFCGAYYGANLNPVAMLKRSALLAEACRECPEHLIMCEKFTMTSCFHEIESTCMGMWLSGYAGHYGNRFDQCGYEGISSTVFPEASGAIPVLSHMMLTGETVMDGPELIWQQDMRELDASTTADGYTRRNWGYFPQFVNISIDLFRKVLDGSVRILSRQEVVDRTKVVIVQDLNDGNVDNKENFMSPAGLFKGLYQLDYDGEWLQNGTWMKSSGRYPAIPTVYELLDDVARSFPLQINSSDYAKRWPTIAAKQAELNELFPEQSTGTAFVDRVENAWVCYNPNPYLEDTKADAAFSFRYNTCTGVEMTLSQFSLLQLREFTDSLCCYMTNYRTDDLTLRTDTLRILGATSTPTFSFRDRGDHPASTVVGKADARGYLLTVTHRGPLDLTVYCSGAADRSSAPAVTPAVLVVPSIPAAYHGTRQYEAESFDYKNVGACVKKGYGASYGLTGFSGQGYVYYGKNTGAAALRDTVTVPTAGTYTLTLRYSAPKGAVQNVSLLVNGSRVTTMNLTKNKTDGWQTYTRKVKLNAGSNEVRFSSSSAPSNDLYFDYILIDPVYDETDTALVDSLLAVTPVMTVSRTYLEGFKGYSGAENHESQTVRISGRGMQGVMTFTASDAYEVALVGDSVYSSTVTVSPNAFGIVDDTDLSLRLKAHLALGTYTGTLTCQAPGVATRTVTLLGDVTPAVVSLIYDFESDATATPSTAPAADVKSATGNSCTAGIVNYTATGDSAASHWLKLQAATQRNSTGVINLPRFTSEATDYSVTWRQCVASATTDYKAGVLLRGDDKNVGTASKGYVQGIMPGYVFIANYNRSSQSTEFRIYSSTESTQLSMLCNSSVTSLNPDAKQAVYFRASAQGSSAVTLTFDYSLDGVTWINAARTNDATASRRLQGATQIVWGLAAATTGIYLDDITFRGVTYDEAVTDLPALSDAEFQQAAVRAYFSLTGLPLKQPRPGRLVIERKTFPDGRVESRKVVY
jgi:hypothetical protein